MKKTDLMSTILAGVLLGAGGAQAHDDAYLDTVKAPNGGQLRMAGPYHYELVVAKDSQAVKDNPILVYVTDHAGQKVPTDGASGTVTILSGKSKVAVTLVPDGENRMQGAAEYAASPGMKVVVSIRLPGQGPEQARFTPR
jgi:hypothetical protein